MYFTICIISDFTGFKLMDQKHQPRILKIKDYVMASFAFPLAMFVSITFWTLYAIDRDLIQPKLIDDAIYPRYTDLFH